MKADRDEEQGRSSLQHSRSAAAAAMLMTSSLKEFTMRMRVIIRYPIQADHCGIVILHCRDRVTVTDTHNEHIHTLTMHIYM